ncbi:amidohydrolase [Agromyces sp. MMS24-JH15]|uniref:amidohydrolase n=1 Tax=Agromyces sp. MMS24-JH15 TaxID=3243765 RepID=UPI003749C5D1
MRPADLVVLSDRVLTPDVLADPASAAPGFVAVRDGVIVAVGSGHDAAAWADGAARVIDLGEGTLASGFIDAHIHPVIGLKMARGLDLSGITRRDEARAAIAEYAAGRDDEWILGWGLDPAVFEGGPWDNSLFDGLIDDRKAFVVFFDGHAALVSDAALALGGVTGRETFPDASFVGVDAAGRPTGMLHEMQAELLVMDHLPEQAFEERVDELGALFRGMAESGIVAGHMLDLADPDSIPMLEELERRGDLAIRLRISPWAMPGFTEEDLAGLVALQGRAGRRWEVRGIKLMIDGTVDNGTAWLFEPDTKGESTASLYLEPDEYARAVAYFHERGIPTTTHAIGDRGIAFVAETIAAQPDNGTRHRIEHIETLPDEVLDRIIEAGAATSMQPTHCTHYSKADHSDNWSQRLGTERANRAWRIGDLRARGATVALGSDWPIAPYDPRGIVAAAQLRRPAGRPEIAPVQPAQAISAAHAVEGYTSEYWASVGETGGRLEVGARADLTAFADDPLRTDPDAFAQTVVLLTVVDGDVVVDRAGARVG